ncbi:MAG TPA: hypothetical protein VFY93_14265 [Planctomycetota bacterium]|nr:hypothetical protein [Planctomycetota bacterium]
MAKRNPGTAGTPPGEDEEDRRERFVLHGTTEGIPNAVPSASPPSVNVEAVLRRVEWPERRRAHRRQKF